MVIRNELTWQFMDYGLDLISLAALSCDVENFAEKLIEKKGSEEYEYLEQTFLYFKKSITMLEVINAYFLEETNKAYKDLYKKNLN